MSDTQDLTQTNNIVPETETKTKEPRHRQELIRSVRSVFPTKGSNAGMEMFIVNGRHWSRTEPDPDHTHVELEEWIRPEDSKVFWNVQGFSKDTRMSIDQKIKKLTSVDAGYSLAIASLLK